MQKSVVIKYGGNAMTEPDIRKKVLAAAVKLKNKGIIPVLVHGGGPYINKALNERGRESKFLKGLRCTDKDTMEVVIQVLCGSVNKGLTAEIESLGSRAIGLSGADGGMIKAVRYSDDKELGFAGKVSSIQSDVIELALNNGYIPVISSVGYDIHGQAYNINADMVAGHKVFMILFLSRCRYGCHRSSVKRILKSYNLMFFRSEVVMSIFSCSFYRRLIRFRT